MCLEISTEHTESAATTWYQRSGEFAAGAAGAVENAERFPGGSGGRAASAALESRPPARCRVKVRLCVRDGHPVRRLAVEHRGVARSCLVGCPPQRHQTSCIGDLVLGNGPGCFGTSEESRRGDGPQRPMEVTREPTAWASVLRNPPCSSLLLFRSIRLRPQGRAASRRRACDCRIARRGRRATTLWSACA